jgi:hypothetical protein
MRRWHWSSDSHAPWRSTPGREEPIKDGVCHATCKRPRCRRRPRCMDGVGLLCKSRSLLLDSGVVECEDGVHGYHPLRRSLPGVQPCRSTASLSSMMSRVLSPDARGAGRRALRAPLGRLHPASSVAVLTRPRHISARRVTTVPHAARRCPTRGLPDILRLCKAGCGVCLAWASTGRTSPVATHGRSMAVRGRR